MARNTQTGERAPGKNNGSRNDGRIFVFKVVQSNVYGMIRGFPYRVLAIPGSDTLYSFGLAILDSFGFEFDHPFGFYNNLKRYYQSTVAYELFADDPESRFGIPEGVRGVKKTRLNQVFGSIGQKMLFLFDYGDGWHFLVTLKGAEPAQPKTIYPVLVKSVGDARPQYDDDDEDEDLFGIDDEDEE
ncbi:MAG: hypothetical protein WC382_02720 [Methanoregulaceae archaeon]|jgi:hypothetical protein